MADTHSGPGWSDAQWELIAKTVTEAFDKANVAGKFLPCYGPLPERDDYVRDEVVETDGNEVSVSDDKTLKLFTLAVKVPLSREQVRDESLSSALLAFRRAAILLAQVEDYLVFNGFASAADQALRRELAQAGGQSTDVKLHEKREKREKLAAAVVTSGPDRLSGLVRPPEGNAGEQPQAQAQKEPKAQDDMPAGSLNPKGEPGEELIPAVSEAIGRLEDGAHPGPFACILGSNRFDDAHTPREKSMVLPADRIKPLIRGPLLRSGQMDGDAGILVSLAGTDIDLVVATPPRVQFLQVREDAKYLFRVYEKFTMRIKDESAVEPLNLREGPPRPRPSQGAAASTAKLDQASRKATKTARKEPDSKQ